MPDPFPLEAQDAPPVSDLGEGAGRSLQRYGLRALVVLLALTGVAAGGWLALRDASLVGVREVEVSGVSGPQAKAIRTALATAGRDMTTLRLRPEVLEAAVAPYAVVKSVRGEADFPHRLRVRVTQHVPVAAVVSPRGAVPVAADGTILRGTPAGGLPELKSRLPPAGDRLTDRRTRATVTLLARAPTALRRRVSSAFRGPHGLTIHLAAGPSAHFGSTDRTRAKWASLVAVLASPESRGATAIDVRVPEHPAAAGLEQKSLQRGEGSTQTPG